MGDNIVDIARGVNMNEMADRLQQNSQELERRLALVDIEKRFSAKPEDFKELAKSLKSNPPKGFKLGDIVTQREGILSNRLLPTVNAPAIFLGYFEGAMYDPKTKTHDDCFIGHLDDVIGEVVIYPHSTFCLRRL